MPVYNGEEFLSESIESILNQTFTNYEFIILNDGSLDASLRIIESYQDSRIIVVNRERKGLIASLNEGVRIAKGKYIARMDADDISSKFRLEKQIDFMRNKDLDMCGTFITTFTKPNGYENKVTYPKKDNEIKFSLMFSCPFAHPSVIIKRSILASIKYKNYKHAEDYKLWTDMALMSCRLGNFDEGLLKYRLHKKQISKKYNMSQYIESNKISRFYLSKLNSRTKDLLLLIESIESHNKGGMKDFITYLNSYKNECNIKDELFLEAIRAIFRLSKAVNLKIYFEYLQSTKNLEKDIRTDVFLFFQSIFRLNYTKSTYYYLNNFRKFFRLN